MPTLLHPIYLPAELLEELAERTGNFWSSPQNEAIVVEAVRAFLGPASAAAPAPQSAPQPAPQPASKAAAQQSAAPATPQPPAQSDAGYQWKQLFLPEGTRLRASFGGRPYFAVVEGAQITCGEHAMSPSRFANQHGSGNRNAWKVIWLRLPGSDEWLPAEVCRSARQAAIARILGDAAVPARQRRRRPAAAPQDAARAAGKRTTASAQPAAGRSIERLGVPRPQHGADSISKYALEDGVRSKHATGRGARRRRHAAKHASGKP